MSSGVRPLRTVTVAQRRREIALRVALGAQNRNVLSLVLGEGMKLVLLGSAIGLAGAFMVTRFVSSLLYGVSGTDPITIAAVSLLLLTVALCASWLPARRATKFEPMVALRCE